jgi:hypothetical protein
MQAPASPVGSVKHRPDWREGRGWGGARDSGAGDGNRTHASSLGSCSSAIELHPRGVAHDNQTGLRRLPPLFP